MPAPQFNIPPKEPILELRFPHFIGGLNYSVVESQINDKQSPDMLNVNFDERGAIQKRWGYQRVYADSLGAGQVNSIYDYYRIGQADPIFLVHHGTKLYKDVSGTLTEIASGLTDGRSRWFTFNDVAYLMGESTDFKQFDGTTFQDVDPYVPTVTNGRMPDGSAANAGEDRNYLTARFKDSFNADGTSTVYVLSRAITGDPTTIEANGQTLEEGTDYTVDRQKDPAEVTFDTAPAEGVDNVVVEATMQDALDPTVVTKCRYAAVYGGKNDTRVLYAGHPDVPNLLLWSGLFKPNYVPESGYVLVGSDAEAITALKRFYDYLVIFKERSIWVLQGGKPSEYKINPINDRYGCIAPDSAVVVENDVVFLSRDGVCQLKASTVREYINVEVISENINGGARPGLLNETGEGLQQAKSIDQDGKYWLCLPDNTVYLWDYKLSKLGLGHVWLKYDNFPVSCLIEKDQTLYFGSSAEGLIYKVPTTTADREQYTDDGSPINAYWTSKLFYMDLREWEKYFHFLYFSVKVNKTLGVNIYYQTDRGNNELLKTLEFDTFSYEGFSYDGFQYSALVFPPTQRVWIRKRGEYLQVKFSNSNAGEGLSLLDMVITYELRRQVK